MNISQGVLFILELLFILFLFRKHFSLVKEKKHEQQPNIVTLAIKDAKDFIQKAKQINYRKTDFLTMLISFIAILLLTSAHFFSGFQTKNGLIFWGIDATNGLRHIAGIKMLLISVPTETTSIYDFLLSRFVFLFGLSPEDVYFRLFPLYLSSLFVGGIWLLGKSLTKKLVIIRISLILACLLCGGILFKTTYWSSSKELQITTAQQKLYDYFAKEVEKDSFIIYLGNDKQLIMAMTGRNVFAEKEKITNLKKVLQECNEQKVQKLLKNIGSTYILSETKESCLSSEKIRGMKLTAKDFYFYEVN